MSGPLVSKALAADLPGPEKLTLVALASHARADGTHCWPGKALLAAEVGRDTRTVQRHLKRLIGWGFISLLSDHQGGRGRRDSYLIQIAKGEAVKGDTSVSLSGNKGRHGCRKRETWVSLKGDTGVATYKEGTVRNRNEPSGKRTAKTSTRKRRPKRAWEPPPFWAPLTRLKEYAPRNYGPSAETLSAACENNGVDPLAVVEGFCEYWPTGKALWKWANPVRALIKTLDIEIDKAKGRERAGRNGRVERPDAAKTLNIELRSQVQP